MTGKKIFISGAVSFILLIIFVVILISSSPKNNSQKDSIAISTAPVLTKNISLPIRTSGKLASKTELKLSFKVGGIIEKIYVDEGQQVKQGSLLAKLDQSEIEARVAQARSGFEKTKRDLARVKKLFADSVATLEQVQDATTAFEVAQSNLKMAEFNLKHSAIYAPQNGSILKRLAEENELIGAGMPAFFFGSSEKDWIVRTGVTDRDILRLQLGDSALVSFDAYPNHTFPASISEIAEAADPRTGTYEIELGLIRGNLKLVSGFVALAEIFPRDYKQYFIIPIEALVEGDGNKGFVFTTLPNSDRVKKLAVTIGFIYDDKVALQSGLAGVERVVTQGAAYLSEDSVVENLSGK